MIKNSKLIIILLSLMLLLAVSLTAETASKWNISFKKDVNWMNLMPTGHLVAGTDEGLFGIDPATGDILWNDENFKKLTEDNFDIIPFTQYAVINKGKGVFGTENRTIIFDFVEGIEKWNTDALDIRSSLGQFIVPSKNALFIHGRNKKGKEWPRLVNLDDGSLIWENPEFFKKRNPTLFKLKGMRVALMGNQQPMFDTDETMITCFNTKAIRKWNLSDGSLVWETELKGLKKTPPALIYGFAPFELDEEANALYISTKGGMYAINVSDGSLLWGEKPAKVNGIAYQVTSLPQGVLVKGANEKSKPFMVLLDKATGQSKWDKPIKKLKESTGFVVKDDKAYVFTAGKIIEINIADGAITEVVKKVKMDGKEIPGSMSLTDQGFLLKSAQNIKLLNFDGSEIFHTYHKAPGSSLFSKIASTAVLTAINVGSAMDGVARANANASRSGTGRGSASYSLITGNPYLSKRFKATINSRSYTYILSKVEADGKKGIGVVKVNNENGKTEGTIILNDKKPVYEVDNIESRLFYINDKKNITCYDI